MARPVRKSLAWAPLGRGAVRVALLLAAVVLAVLLVVSMVWPPLTEVATGETPEYPELRPQVLRYSPDLVMERAVQALEGQDGWHVTSAERATRMVQAERDSWPLGAQAMQIEVEAFGAGSRVHVRSEVREAPADFGQNARNIEHFQAALAERLELARQVR